MSDRTKKRTRRNNVRKVVDDVLDAALARVREGNQPNVGDCDRLGTVAVIDPFDGTRSEKVTSLREDPIGQMHRRGQLLTDDEKRKRVSLTIADVRLEAARRWQTLYELAEIGGARAIDPGKEHVDGGRFVEPDTDRSGDARDELRTLHHRLGMIELTPSQRITGERLLVWVLGERKTIKQVQAMLGVDQRLVSLGRCVIRLLDKVAIQLKSAMRPALGPVRQRDRYDETSDRYLRPFSSFSGHDSE